MNLADAQSREIRQSDKLSGRASVLPERRNTNAPDLRPAGDMRSARRGDTGGAEALMRTLGLVEKATGDFQDYAQRKHAADEQDNISQGFGDQATDRVDPEKMERSLGYRNAVTKGRTVTEFSRATRGFGQVLDRVIESQDSPLLEDRQKAVSLMVEEFYRDFATDSETGELRAYLQSPGAMRYLAGAIQESRPQFEAGALKRIEERFNTEARSHFSTNIVDQAVDTNRVDINAARSLLPETVTDEEMAETALIAIFNAANALRADGRQGEAEQLLRQLRGYSTKPLVAPVGDVGPTGVAPAGTVNASGAAGQFASEFRNAGLSEAVIAGFLGNIQHESGFDSSREGDGGSAFGHVQWRKDRVSNFERVVGVHPKNATPAQSVQFIKWELDNYREAGMTKGQRDAILNAQTPEDAARAIDKFYERSNGRSTRDRMSAARSYFDGAGAASEPAAAGEQAPAPGYRLTDPFADPVTAAQQSNVITAEIVGLEGITFSAAQQARINEVYEATTDQMRREWNAKVAEEQSQNATRLALGLFNVGGLTTRQDILDARANGQIDDSTLLTLLRTQESNEEQRQNQIDRQLDRVDREEAQKHRRMEEAAVGSLVGALARGDINAAELREATISLLPNLPPAIQGSVLSQATSIANGMENALANSAPARRHTTRWNETTTGLTSRVVEWGIVPSQRKAVQALAETAIESGQVKFLQRVIEGEDPDKVAEEIDAEIGRQHGGLVRRYGTQGQP